MSPLPPPALSRAHELRLRQYHRCGWPCLDTIELDLLAAGLIRRSEMRGHELMHLTDAGLAALHAATERTRAALDAHEQLIDRVATLLVQQQKLVYRGLAFRVRSAEGWQQIRPDLFALRRTSVEDYLQPQVYEIKARRGDLLGDLRRPAKRAGYLRLAGACTYVLAEGVGDANDIPPECGVMLARNDRLDLVRPAPTRACRLDFATWMVLAQAGAQRLDAFDDPQDWLGPEPSA